MPSPPGLGTIHILRQQRTRVSGSKGGFFSRKCDSFFRSPNFEKKIFQKIILNLKFKIPAQNSIMLLAGILNFKFKIVFWNIFFSRFGDVKNKSHFLKKTPLEDFFVSTVF